MKYTITIEDVAYYAMAIGMSGHTDDDKNPCRYCSYKTLEQYGAAVEKIMNYANMDSRFVRSSGDIDKLILSDDVFEKVERNGEPGLALKDGAEEKVKSYIWNLPLDITCMFFNEYAISAICDERKEEKCKEN